MLRLVQRRASRRTTVTPARVAEIGNPPVNNSYTATGMSNASPPMPRSLRFRIAIILLTAAVFLSALAVAYWYFLLRAPLAGNTHHDFGDVVLTQPTTEFTHRFHLTNDTVDTITIAGIRPDCGCVRVEASTRVLKSGDSVDVNATLLLSCEGLKRTRIHLDLGEHGRQVLRLQATGIRPHSPD